MSPTDEEVLALKNVPLAKAAAYLHMSHRKLSAALRQGVCPVGFAVCTDGKWTYHIPGKRLHGYMHGLDLRC